jgi:hypothetical protein
VFFESISKSSKFDKHSWKFYGVETVKIFRRFSVNFVHSKFVQIATISFLFSERHALPTMCASVPPSAPVLGSVGTNVVDSLLSDDLEMPDLIDAVDAEYNLHDHANLINAIHIPLPSNHSVRRTVISDIYSIMAFTSFLRGPEHAS